MTDTWSAEVVAQRLPGTRLSLSGNIKLVRNRSDWLICFRFPELFIREDILLSDWLWVASGESQEFYVASRTLNGEQAAQLAGRFKRAGFHMQRGSQVQFVPWPALDIDAAGDKNSLPAGVRRPNVFLFEHPEGGLRFGRRGARVHAGSAVLNWTPEVDSIDDPPDGPVTCLLPAHGGTFQGDEGLGSRVVDGNSTSVSILHGRFLGGGLFYSRDKHKNSVLDIAFRLGGMLKFKHGFHDPWPELPFFDTDYRLSVGASGVDNVSMIGGPGGRPGTAFASKAYMTRGGHVEFVVKRRAHAKFLTLRDRSVTSFEWVAELCSAFVPLEQTDVSRIDCHDMEMRVVMGSNDAPGPVTKNAILTLGKTPTFSMNLDRRSRLFVHRAADFLDLKLGFRSLYLKATPEKGMIDRRVQPVAGGNLTDEDRPIILVHLPPQHVAERVYLHEPPKMEEEKAATNIKAQAIYQTSDNKVPQNGKPNGTFKSVANNYSEDNLKNNQTVARQERNPRLKTGGLKLSREDRTLVALVEARASGPTRIVLEEEDTREGDTPRFPMRFSAAELLNFTGFRTRVSSRALERGSTIQDQLNIAGIDAKTNIVDKVTVIGNQLDGQTEGRIGDEETKIEYPYDLHLSPASSARWTATLPPDEARLKRGMGLFTIRIDPTFGADSVRALWSRAFEKNLQKFFTDKGPEARGLPLHSANDPAFGLPGLAKRTSALREFCKIVVEGPKSPSFRMSNDERDRMELVLLTSIYGLPSLLPEPLAINKDGDKAGLSSDVSVQEERRAAPPTVFPLPDPFPTASDPLLGREGVYEPQPLELFDVGFSASGATGHLLGRWAPPAAFFRLSPFGFDGQGGFYDGAEAPEYPALTIEKWSHRTYLSRDIEAEFVYKAFLFPFGHRASVVKTTERLMLEDPCHAGKQVAYLVQKFFVVIDEPEKTLPAMGMPFKGRGVPCSGIRMVTTKAQINAPELPIEGGSVAGATQELAARLSQIGGQAFHPVRVGGTGKEPAHRVQFEFVIQYPDGSESDIVSAPLIVIDNTTAHDPKAVRALMKAYNSRGDVSDESKTINETISSRARFGMQRVRYAPEREKGDTEFRTDHWVLGAHPREIEDAQLSGTAAALAPYTMDGAMEGADQPPFYPAMKSSAAEIQSINTMNGRSGGLTRVGIDAHYLAHGFAPGTNDAEIFLSIIGQVDIDTSKRKNASGGLATPNSKIISLSRLKGPVGGSVDDVPTVKSTLPVVATAAASLTARVGNVAPSGRLPASHSNKFDPLEYFGKALSGAKLFGIIPLKDVVKAIGFIDGAPELLESATQSILDFEADTKDDVLAVIAKLRQAIATVQREADEAAGDLPGDVTAATLYPDLFRAFSSLDNALASLGSAVQSFDTVNAPDTGPVLDGTGAVVETGQRVVDEVQRVIRNPIPTVLMEFIDNLRGLAEGRLPAFRRDAETFEVRALIVAPPDLVGDVRKLIEEVKRDLMQKVEDLLTVVVCNKEGTFEIVWDEKKAKFNFLAPILGVAPEDIFERFRDQHLKQNGGQGPIKEMCITFSLSDKDVWQDAQDTVDAVVADLQKAQDALYYELVGKPLIDGYLAYEQFKARVIADAVNVDTVLKDMPGEITKLAEQWVDGVLRLERLSSVMEIHRGKLDGTAESVWKVIVRPALLDVVVPVLDPLLRSAIRVNAKASMIDAKLLDVAQKLERLVLKAPTPEAAGALQQILSAVASSQKQVRDAMADLTSLIDRVAIRPDLEGEPEGNPYFDLRVDFDNLPPEITQEMAEEIYLQPLKDEYDKFAAKGIGDVLLPLQTSLARILVAKEKSFRAMRSTMQAGVDALREATRLSEISERSKLSHEDLPADVRVLRFTPRDLTTDLADVKLSLFAALGAIMDGADSVFSSNSTKMANMAAKTSIDAAKDHFEDAVEKASVIKNNYEVHRDKLRSNSAKLKDDTLSQTEREQEILASARNLDDVIAYTFGEERVVMGVALQGLSLFNQAKDIAGAVEKDITLAVFEVARPAVGMLLTLDGSVLTLLQVLREYGQDDEIADTLRLFLEPRVYQALFVDDAKINLLRTEISELEALKKTFDDAATVFDDSSASEQQKNVEIPKIREAAVKFSKVLDAWKKGNKSPAAVAALRPVVDVLDILSSGRLDKLINLRGLEAELKKTLRSLIPLEQSQEFGWGTTIDPFPSESGKFFWIDRGLRPAEPRQSGPLVTDFFERRKKDKLKPDNNALDLVIASKAGVRFDENFQPKPFFAIESYIFDPSINLFSASFDVVTIRFEYIRFIADQKGSDLDVEIRKALVGPKAGVAFGKVVQYIAELAESFGGLVPPWLELRPELPGVAARFGFPAIDISIGTMSIFGLSVNIEVEVPFSDIPITSRFRLSERNRPFTISFAPYGGGGYLGLICRATEIVGFELQLEFGAMVAIAFGPLKGFGGVTAGIYIEQQKGRDLIIAGFVRAIGEGSLGCFHIAVHIEVRVIQEGQNVTGEATFAYSFKVSFASFRFSFKAAYAFAGGKNDSSDGREAQLSAPESIRSLLTDGNSEVLDIRLGEIIVDVEEPDTDWAAYRKLFL